MQSLRSISSRHFRNRIFVEHSTSSILRTSSASFFLKFFQPSSNKLEVEKSSDTEHDRIYIMDQKLEQVEQNQANINARLEKLESLVMDNLKKQQNSGTDSSSPLSNIEINMELAKYTKMQSDLQVEISALTQELAQLQKTVTGQSVDLSFLKNLKTSPIPAAGGDVQPAEAPTPVSEKAAPTKKESQKKEKAPKQPKPAKQPAAAADDAKPLDASRLDLRVGKIVHVEKHPDADSLYVEQIECGEEKPRTVVSGLVKFVPLEQMQDRMVVILCNLKPAKMRGVLSEAMVMCASTADKVEVLAPPAGAVPGDRVTFEKFAGEPDSQLNPKKKIWEQIAPDLTTNGDLVATYKGDPFIVAGKGPVVAETLKNVQVK